MKIIKLFFAIIVIIVVYSCSDPIEFTASRQSKCWKPLKIDSATVYTLDKNCMKGARIPHFMCKTFHGQIYDNDARKVFKVYNLWFMSCPPCIAEIPGLNRLVETYPNIEFISICLDGSSELKQFLKNNKFKFIHIANGKEVIDKYFFNSGFPTTLVVNRENIIIEIFTGGRTDSLASKEIFNKVSSSLK
jgi:thiol-disulfide isomerase/thioredoxin